jgi:hypothetical protein
LLKLRWIKRKASKSPKQPRVKQSEQGFEPKGDSGADDDAGKEPESVRDGGNEEGHGLKTHAEVNAKSDPGKERPHQENDFDDCDQEKNEKFRHGGIIAQPLGHPQG